MQAKEAAIAAVADLAGQVKEAASEVDRLESEFDSAILEVPNLVAPDAAEGFGEEDSLEIKRVGEPLTEGTDHATLGETLGIIDTVRAAKVSGSRFGYLKGKGAMLEFSLVRWAMDHLVAEGFTPMVPPVLVREEALVGTGFFPEAREQVYEIPRDELFLVGTAEVPLAAYHTDEILESRRSPPPVRRVLDLFPTGGRDLREGHGRHLQGPPVRQGRDVRVHRAGRVSRRSTIVSSLWRRSWSAELEIPYRVVNVAAGDLGASAAKKYDIEAWFPGEQAYREITSCSNTTDYQARRLKIRMRTEQGERGGAHAQRDGLCRRSHHPRHPRESSAARRLGRHSRGAPSLHGIRCHRAVSEVSDPIFARIAARYDLINRILSLGQEKRWRARGIEMLEPGTVLDLGCGTGATDFEGRVVVGLDPVIEMLALSPVRDRVVGTGEALPFQEASLDGGVQRVRVPQPELDR